MRSACSEAVQYGNQLLPDGANNRRVIVILNPTANKREAAKSYEKFCGPVLYLAGIRVDIVKTEAEGFARSYIETELKELPDAILVAGGDGTLSEVVTGLLRRTGTNQSCPVGVLPVGRTNSVAERLFPGEGGGRVRQVEQLTSAAMSIIRGQLAKKDVLKIEILPEPDEAEEGPAKKPIYAVASIKWGAFRDAMALRDKYWYYGGLRERAAILFNAFKSTTLNWDCRGVLNTTPPCHGCVDCFQGPSAQHEYKGRNWWSFLVPTKSSSRAAEDSVLVDGQDVRSRVNPECSTRTESKLEAVNELLLTTSNVEDMQPPPKKMLIRLGSANVATTDWIRDAWRRTTDELSSSATGRCLESRTVELIPERKPRTEGPEEFYSIDNEAFEVKPIRVTLLPGHINMFT